MAYSYDQLSLQALDMETGLDLLAPVEYSQAMTKLDMIENAMDGIIRDEGDYMDQQLTASHIEASEIAAYAFARIIKQEQASEKEMA